MVVAADAAATTTVRTFGTVMNHSPSTTNRRKNEP
jgi:hypothetical protein